jgi:hypothetical protein
MGELQDIYVVFRSYATSEVKEKYVMSKKA